MRLRNIVWWAIFFILAIPAQMLLPGIDILVVGLIIAMQERKPLQIIWVLIISMLLQEGQGTMDFGASFCWYGLTMFIYYIGRAIFETENIFFILLVCASLGVLHFGLMQVLSGLQGVSLPFRRLALESVGEMLIVPVLWLALHKLRRGVARHAD